jgi:hypothetical protein
MRLWHGQILMRRVASASSPENGDKDVFVRFALRPPASSAG